MAMDFLYLTQFEPWHMINTVDKTLVTIATGKDGQLEVPTDEKDIDTLYKYAIHVLNT